jgi:hypothetical protein
LTKNTKVTIKFSGKRTAVLTTLKKVKPIFPLFIEGKINDNENGDGIHVFLTVAVDEAEA